MHTYIRTYIHTTLLSVGDLLEGPRNVRAYIHTHTHIQCFGLLGIFWRVLETYAHTYIHTHTNTHIHIHTVLRSVGDLLEGLSDGCEITVDDPVSAYLYMHLFVCVRIMCVLYVCVH